MTDPHYTAVALLSDRSGSMMPIRDTAQSAINEFISAQGQRSDQRVTVRLDEFDGIGRGMPDLPPGEPPYRNVFPSTPAADCPPYVLMPRGMTALWDAWVRSMTEFGAELAALPEDQRPGAVVWAVMTDGQENSSREHTAADVAALIKQQREQYRWQIVFLGADEATVEQAVRMGVDPGSAMAYAASHVGTRSTVESFDRYVVASAAGPATFSDEDRRRSKRQDP